MRPFCGPQVKLLVRFWAYAIFFVGLTCCKSREVGSNRSAEDGEAKLVFEDRFSEPTLQDHWVRGEGESGAGEWAIEQGQLRGSNLHNDPLWLKQPLPEEVRIEFEAEALSPAGDIKVEAFGDGQHHASGYIFIFGGWKNALDVIARLDEHGKDRIERPTRGVVPNKTYRMRIERRGGKLTWWVDDQLFMKLDDDSPLRGAAHQYFGFSNWEAPVKFDNLRIYSL